MAAEAECRGLIVVPGPVFAVEGGLDGFLRVTWTNPLDQLDTAVHRLAQAWNAIDTTASPRPRLVVA